MLWIIHRGETLIPRSQQDRLLFLRCPPPCPSCLSCLSDIRQPPAEMWRLGAIETTSAGLSPWPKRAFCAAEILARAAALILCGPCDMRVLLIPLSALIAVSNAFTCCAALSLSAFNCAIMSMCSSPGEDCAGGSPIQAALL